MGRLPSTWATRISHSTTQVNAWCAEFLNPYLNYHRPCLFPESVTDAKGKTRKRYPQHLIMTPCEKLLSMAAVSHFLHPGVTPETLRANANAMSDNEAADAMNQARQRLFLSIHKRSRPAA